METWRGVRLCTYEPLTVEFILQTMKFHAGVEGFLPDATPVHHDNRLMDPCTFPAHDLSHFDIILTTVVLIRKKRILGVPIDDRLLNPHQITNVRQSMKQLYGHIDILLEAVEQGLIAYPEEYLTLTRMMLYEVLHEQALYRLLLGRDTFACSQKPIVLILPASAIEIEKIYEEVEREVYGKYREENNPHQNTKLEKMINTVPKKWVCAFFKQICDESFQSYSMNRPFLWKNLNIPDLAPEQGYGR